MFQLDGAIVAKEGYADDLFEILQNASVEMEKLEECIKYEVKQDIENPARIIVHETWVTEEAHDQSLQEPVVIELISKARHMIESME